LDKLAHLDESRLRYLISRFDSEDLDKLFLVPWDREAGWPSLDRETGTANPFVSLCIVPPYWQLAPVFYETMRRRGIPAIILPTRNIPLAAQMVKEVGVQSIVAGKDGAKELHELCSDKALLKPILFWHIALSLREQLEPDEFGSVPVFQEKHVFPGIAVACQCATMAKTHSRGFHLSKDYLWEITAGKTLITSLRESAMPFIRYDLGAHVRGESSVCACGERTIFYFD
jgi:hypothetical protein